MTENFANNYSTALDGAINDTQTTFDVLSVSGVPSVNFRIKIDNELMLVTGVASLTFTVTREIEGTSAASHSSSTLVTHVLTAGGLEDAFVPAVTSMPGSPSVGKRVYRSDLGLDFEYNGTRWLSELFVMEMLFTPGVSFPISATNNNTTRTMAPALQGGSDIWIVAHNLRFIVNSGGTALSASHKWVATPHTYDSAVSAANFVTVSIDSGSSGTMRLIDTAVGALMNNGSDKFMIMTTWTKTGTPGTLEMIEAISYRIVVT